ncbi:VWA domain-containing protein [Rariglobus hedericola]|uniref:VWA domain-containing protein n=1 Tax=Rariglobus hedericola TaxID=2597822 RepID=A0A556QS41_9BACT|nr:VWA domain-containing protein [Rariglobus hedericola]TSJ79465.1 VWA domain-containing protein [Rariglobus hedericola]
MDWLRTLFYPGSTSSSGSTSLTFEGLDPGWALIGWIVFALVLWWLHARLISNTPRVKRGVIVGLRLLFAAALLFAATRPVLITTLVEKVRQKLIVMVDASASMDLADLRTSPEDRARALIASGKLSPDGGLSQTVPSDAARPTRRDVVKSIASNGKLNLWSQLNDRAELVFYTFGHDATETPPPASGTDGVAAAKAFFDALPANDQTTALGESLRQILDRHRGEPLAGVFVMTDGANNRGLAPSEAAVSARADGIPLFLYGVGVTEPKDVALTSADAPRIAFLKERVNIRVRLTANGFEGQPVVVSLRDPAVPNSALLAESTVTLAARGTVDTELSFIPEKAGEIALEVASKPLDGEASADNNVTTVRIRVIDNRVRVFMIDQEPRWDWRYLLDFLQDDRRLTLKCVLLDGDPSLLKLPNTPFIAELPNDRAALYDSDIILLGDVDPARLGRERMQLIREWVDQAGGGLVFLAGPNHNPRSYLGTPLEALLPVVPLSGPVDQLIARHPEPVQLALTSSGARSPLLRLAERESDNTAAWRQFAGVRWTAKVARARPGAEVLLVDPSPSRATPNGPGPVLARQRFGRGEVMYFGFNETYRWRSSLGGKYYSKIWSQIFQALSLERLSGASKQVQLRVDRPEYQLGERVVISGRLYQPDFKPLIADVVPARASFTTANSPDPIQQEVMLRPVPEEAGGYRAEFTPAVPGRYKFYTMLDPTALVELDVVEPRLEQSDAAMNLALLDATATASGGRLLREENLFELPKLLEDKSGSVTSLKRLELAYSPVLMALILLFACAEWLVRRLNRLK